MFNEHAITDQKVAVGLVENPCCWALEAHAAHVPAGHAIVELGSFKGRTTGWLTLGSQAKGNQAAVHAFDPWEAGAEAVEPNPSARLYRLTETREAFENHMAETGCADFVTAHQMAAVEGAKAWCKQKVGLLWHDALHDFDSVFADLKAWLPKMADDAVVVLHDTDDIRYGVNQAAEQAFTRTKTLRDKWDWEGREVHMWPQNVGKAPEDRRRGFTVIHSRKSTYPKFNKPILSRIV